MTLYDKFEQSKTVLHTVCDILIHNFDVSTDSLTFLIESCSSITHTQYELLAT